MLVETITNKNNFSFNFVGNTNVQKANVELPFSEHVEELRQRTIHTLSVLILVSILAFCDIKPIVELLQIPVVNIKFFQLAPGEYFLETVKIAFYSGLTITSPILLSQFTFFIIPGLTANEKRLLLPLWSFSQYCDFILVLFSTTAIAFQIPIFQIILGVLEIISGTSMLNLWKYVVLIAVIVGAVLTPSTDPITQLLLSSAILILYFLGAGILILLKR
jgi:sec-independent protein translocase protein TatC